MTTTLTADALTTAVLDALTFPDISERTGVEVADLARLRAAGVPMDELEAVADAAGGLHLDGPAVVAALIEADYLYVRPGERSLDHLDDAQLRGPYEDTEERACARFAIDNLYDTLEAGGVEISGVLSEALSAVDGQSLWQTSTRFDWVAIEVEGRYYFADLD